MYSVFLSKATILNDKLVMQIEGYYDAVHFADDLYDKMKIAMSHGSMRPCTCVYIKDEHGTILRQCGPK